MSNNDLSVILAWMKKHPSHLDWDLTLAMRPEYVNDLVESLHYSRPGATVADLQGEIAVPGTEVVHVLTGYRVGPVLLTDVQADYASPKVRQSLELEGGTHLIMDKVEGLIGLAEHDPLDPLLVTHMLTLQADALGVRVDLTDSLETELDLGGSLLQRLAAGRFFKDFVSGLDITRRVYPLVDFQALAGNPFLQVRYSAARIHMSKANGQLALVVFAALDSGPTGSFPAEQGSYPFLLPDDLAQPSTSALMLTSRLLHRAAYGAALEQMLEGGAFEPSLDSYGVLQRMDAKAGQLRVHPTTYRSEDYEFECQAFAIAVGGTVLDNGRVGRALERHPQTCCCCNNSVVGGASDGSAVHSGRFESPLSIVFDHDEVRQHWKSYATLTFSYRHKRDPYWQTYTATFLFDLLNTFHMDEPLTPQEHAGCMLLGHVLWPLQQSVEVTPVSGLPTSLSAGSQEEISTFVAFAIKQAVLEGLAKQLKATVPEDVVAGLTPSTGHCFKPFHFELPDGMAMFSNGKHGESFSIVDPALVLAAGKQHTFTVEPARADLLWTLEAMPGEQGDLGRIDAMGHYRAPPAHAMIGRPMRVRVVATDPATGQRSEARVTVVLGAMTVNPLIRVCYAQDQLTLTAGTLGGDLNWSVRDASQEGRGRLSPDESGKRCTYTAGDPVAGTQTYVLDEIQVRDGLLGESRSVYVLVRQRRPELIIQIVDQLPGGGVQLQCLVNGQALPGVQWTLPIAGTGSIQDDGRFTPPDAEDAPAFTLIMAKFELSGTDFVFEGHLILPLPLSLHFDAMRRAASPSGLAVVAPQTLGE